MERKLPVGEQDFASIRREGSLYVDKTALLHTLVTGSGNQFFFSRPRRFGKSLLCSTLAALFAGKRELFQAIAGQPPLAIDTLPWDWQEYPVIRIDLNAGDYVNKGLPALNELLEDTLRRIADNAGLSQHRSKVLFCQESFGIILCGRPAKKE
jgi:hypothetical protein